MTVASSRNRRHARERDFIQHVAKGLSPYAAAKAVEPPFHPAGAARVARRLAPDIAEAKRLLSISGVRKPAHKVSVGDQMRYWHEGAHLDRVEPARALDWWRQRRAEHRDVEIRWMDPPQLEVLQAQRILIKAAADLRRATEHTVRVFEAHGEPLPADLMVKPDRGRANAEATLTTAVDEAVVDAPAAACRLHPSQPAKGCPLCKMAPQRCPRHGLIYEPTVIHGASGPVGQRTACPECEPGTVTIYATERSRQLAWTSPERILARTGGGRPTSAYAPRSYGEFDPFEDF